MGVATTQGFWILRECIDQKVSSTTTEVVAASTILVMDHYVMFAFIKWMVHGWRQGQTMYALGFPIQHLKVKKVTPKLILHFWAATWCEKNQTF